MVSHFTKTTTVASAKEIATEQSVKRSRTSPQRLSSKALLKVSTAQVPKVMKSMVGMEMATAS